MFHNARLLLLSLLLIGCSSVAIYHTDLDALYGKEVFPDRQVQTSTPAGEFYQHEVKPVLENRCIVCHGCYDAPCQLKLNSTAGIERGASKDLVYDGTRFLAAEPSRLGVDARNVKEWREKDFFAVLNERTQNSTTHLANSLLYKMLELKQQHPLPEQDLLPPSFELGLNRKQQCSTMEEFPEFQKNYPLWGMPYALPGLAEEEMHTLTQWIASGAAMSPAKALPDGIKNQIEQWEAFLNADDNKTQLTSRYIYEHLFLANLYFDEASLFVKNKKMQSPEFYFKLVRSSTPPGFPIVETDGRRPYNDPGVHKVYYRLKRLEESIAAKNHMPYVLNQQRLDWIKELFITPEYEVKSLPGYSLEEATNPMVTFKDLPLNARYKFMLMESEFIIKGFIKGPVCRGQIALNVIDDHFWVFFIDPDSTDEKLFNQFLTQQSENLRLPGEASSNSGIVANWVRYSTLHNKFLQAKNEALNARINRGQPFDLDLIWDGNQQNPNASLTVFRHFDSSTVIPGMVGQQPKTAWLIGYPLLERIHYLLVAEFDVYGNIGHQLMTRLYMDFLRMEGEYNFLALLPEAERKHLADYWYRGASDDLKEHLLIKHAGIKTDPAIEYSSNYPKTELVGFIRERLGKDITDNFDIYNNLLPPEQALPLAKINAVRGIPANLMPETATLTVLDNLNKPQLYTLIRNSGHTNISSFLMEDENRLPEEDYLTIVPGILGDYPNAHYRIQEREIPIFVKQLSELDSEQAYRSFADQFSVRRTNKNFWLHSDMLHAWYRQNDPLNAGILDYNRLENR